MKRIMPRLEHTPVPRARAFDGPALLTQGFRPFFLLAGLWAPLALLLSLGAIRGEIALPTAFDPIAWHAHELMHGYAAAVIAGFLLTAIPNWTGRLPLQGLPLLALVLLWFAGRLALLTSSVIGILPAAALDVAFPAALVGVALREIVAGRNWRNLVPVAGVLVLLAANALSYAAAAGLVPAGLDRRLAIAVVVMLIALIGGRVVPSFSRNWLVKRGAVRLPASFGPIDRLALVVTLLAFAAWVAVPEHDVTAGALALAALLQLIRLLRWRGWATGREPLLWVLHLGYLWLPVGLALLAASHWLPVLPPAGALHALTAGAIATMTLAVMSRAILGHTGRELAAGPGLTAVFLLITLAAAARVAASLLAGGYDLLLAVAAGAWCLAYAIYLWQQGPMLLGRRPAG
jgi:uncharacterized protein involved in response to NO